MLGITNKTWSGQTTNNTLYLNSAKANQYEIITLEFEYFPSQEDIDTTILYLSGQRIGVSHLVIDEVIYDIRTIMFSILTPDILSRRKEPSP